MNKLCVFLFVFFYVVLRATSDNILGCGGFVKSHVPIDFSKVEVKLLTKQGILKDKINCAPNNGYYFVPLYDKGEYILELEPPPGWSFTPTRVDLVVDGVTDLCSQGKDIDFNFKGFGITGRVESLGSDSGPEGVEVELKSSSEVRKTTTSSGGSFFFTPVYPGNYVVKISTSKWKVYKDSVNVVVAEGNTELAAKSLIIQGYDVVGAVKDEGEPIKDTTVVLYAQTSNTDLKIDGCDKSPLSGLKSANRPLCHVKTNDQGVFTFGTLPYGKYYVAPFYIEQNIYYQPDSIPFTVEHGSVKLKENFEIIGFNVNGRVLKSSNGKPLPKARVFLNGKEVTQTDSNGVYKLQRLKAGTYNLHVIADNFLFKEVAVKMNPNSRIPDLVPTSYQVCGSVVSDKSQSVTFAQIGSTKVITTLSDMNSGQFCEYLSPGKYQVQVVVDSADSQKGMQFFPKVQNIEVSSEQVGSIIFSQLKATVTGKVQCISKKDCQGLKAILKPSGEKNEIVTNISDDSYKIADIYPGIYEITISDNKLCWKSNKQTVNVNNINVEVPTFVQVGYSVVFSSSHDTQVTYKIPGQNQENTIKINKGKLAYCLEKAGAYTFHLKSCHSYESSSVSYNTDSATNEIFLNAQKHTVTLLIESETKHGDVTATINLDGVKTQSPPLPFVKNGYEIQLLLSPSETAVIIPQSDVLYFSPPILSISGSTDCENLGAKFKAVLGVVFQGKIIPPLPGVLVTVETENFDTLMAETDANGVYKFPPLDKSKSYKIAAKKDSYVLVGPNNDGNFLAHKLAEIVIEVVDKNDNAPLQGALLSLSGGDSYRSNLQTNENGKITFHSLSPGEYFLRPMMKEYSFEPSSKIIKVNEGQTVNVKLTGKRVAYSAYGQVTSLNREPEENIVVVALGVGNCSHFSEESTSESSGLFRIRGLQPFCSYDITVKSSPNAIERSAPKVVHVERVSQDIHGLQLVIFRPATHMDLLVKVYAKNPEHYKSLRLKVVCETASSGIVYTGRVDTSSIAITADYNQGVLVQVPPLPLDGKTYSVHLESNLNNKLEPEPETFIANSSFKYVELDFIVKSSMVEQEIKQTSIWTLVLIFSIMFAVYNIDKVSQFLKEMLGGYVSDFLNSANKKSATSDYSGDNDDIDQIVQSINAVKRKPKPKKN
ncbi:BOS complex subunit NOMO1 [Tribolium castaneum]|uniref:BOS complex subunit NOMO1 n=1 Tax=Tribolium castaneum TaxID=7070 RepID=UPI0030FEE753